jgi:hypothetical protein
MWQETGNGGQGDLKTERTRGNSEITGQCTTWQQAVQGRARKKCQHTSVMTQIPAGDRKQGTAVKKASRLSTTKEAVRPQETRNCGQEDVKIEHTEGSSKTTGDKELQARRLRD